MIKSTGNVIEMNTKSEVARPLRVLEPLITEDLANGMEAAEKAGMPYYRAAGEKMLEARSQLKEPFRVWVKRKFGISYDTAYYYMKLARATIGRQESNVFDSGSLNRFIREEVGHQRPTSGAVRREWREDVDKLAERARQAEARIKEEHLTREQEREAKRKLAERLIDIGYKVLAKELHPDKGGSKDAIQRLHEVRAELKGHRFN